MTADWFEVDSKGEIILKKEAKGIPVLKDIIKSKDSKALFEYIWHSCNHRSPYAAYSDSERQVKIREDFLKSREITPILIKATEEYSKTLETVSMRLLRAAKRAALSLAQYLEEEGGKIDSSNRKDIVDTLDKVGKIIESLDKLEEKVKKEITNNDNIRGGGDVGQRER